MKMPAPTRYFMVVSVKPEAACRLTRSQWPPQNPGRFDDGTSRLASRRPAIAPVSTMVPRTSGSAPTRSKLRYRTRLIHRAGAATGITRLRHGGAIESHDREATMANALSDKERVMIDAYWRAANYLSVGQIYLYDNPLLEKPLTKEHIKPRLLGHWGTTPGLNFIYAHLNRLIKKHDLDMIYITGPGHGGPGLVANAYLEGTYSEVYPNISADKE